jgi:tRNA(His) 5'-end guanylyltransferase
MNNKLKLDDRMKQYEHINRNYLIPNMYNVIRLDGKAFHTYTKQFIKPFDDVFINAMNETAKYICETMQGAKFAFVQSDEISIYFTDTDNHEQQLWFGGNIQKIVSVAASKAAAKFNQIIFLHNSKSTIEELQQLQLAEFDARVFQLPNKHELLNCFIWRQEDCIRNSVSTVAQYFYSTKELHKKTVKDMKTMLLESGRAWENYNSKYKNGRFISKEIYINDILVGDNETEIRYQPDNEGIFKSKYGRALQLNTSENDEIDWCDIKIKKMRSFWNISNANIFLNVRETLIKKYFHNDK